MPFERKSFIDNNFGFLTISILGTVTKTSTYKFMYK